MVPTPPAQTWTVYDDASPFHRRSSRRVRDRRRSALDPRRPTVGEALRHLRVTGVFYSRTEADGPWAVDMPAFGDCVSFHVVTVGEAWVEVDGAPPVRLVPGDLALVPHGRGHLLRSSPGVPSMRRVDELPQEYLSPNYSVLRHEGSAAPGSS